MKKLNNFISYDLQQNFVELYILPEELTFSNAHNVSNSCSELLEKLNYMNTIVNLEKVIYIDSSGLAIIKTVSDLLQHNNNELVLICDSDNIIQTLKLLRLDNLVKIFPTSEDAITYVSNKK